MEEGKVCMRKHAVTFKSFCLQLTDINSSHILLVKEWSDWQWWWLGGVRETLWMQGFPSAGATGTMGPGLKSKVKFPNLLGLQWQALLEAWGCHKHRFGLRYLTLRWTKLYLKLHPSWVNSVLRAWGSTSLHCWTEERQAFLEECRWG